VDKIIIEYVKIGDLKPYEGNPRKIDDTEMKKLRKSLVDFGFVDPVIARKSDNMVIGGHMRLLAAKHEGYETVPVVYTEFEDSKAAMLNIALNKISGEFDWPKLGDLFQEFDDGEFDLEMSGFSTEEIEDLMAGLDAASGEIEEDEVPEVPDDPITKTGDLWIMGEHRLLCGDSTKAEDVGRLMGGEKAEVMATDPPYGIGYEYDQHKDETGEKYTNFCDIWFDLGLSVSMCSVITTGWKYKPFWYTKNPTGEMVWFDKTKQSGHTVAHLRKSEPIFVFGKIKEKYDWDTFTDYGDRGDGLRKLHSCPKPVSLFSELIKRQTSGGGLVYEPFSGSGTTTIAAEQLKRKCYAMEISPNYVDVAVTRWENLTGKKAVLDGSPIMDLQHDAKIGSDECYDNIER
jgi:DNA modification methylase